MVSVVMPPLLAAIEPGAAATVVCAGLTFPGFAVATKFTGAAAPNVARADCVLVAADVAVPRVQDAVAMPDPFETDVVGATEPPPPGADQVTVTPDTGLPEMSVTSTPRGVASVAPTVSVWPSPAWIASWAAGPAVSSTVPDEMPVRPGAEKPNVRAPASPGDREPVKVAMPEPLVVAVVVPPRVPPPVAIWTVMTTPACPTGLLAASRRATDGCCGSTVPLATVRRRLGGHRELRGGSRADGDGARRHAGESAGVEPDGVRTGRGGQRQPAERPRHRRRR